MVRIIFILLFCQSVVVAQCDYCDDGRDGTLRMGVGLSLSTLPAIQTSLFSGNGNIDYYISDAVSFRGDVYLGLGALNESDTLMLSQNHQLLSGFNYHLIKNKPFDPYIGAQVGVSLTRLTSKEISIFPNNDIDPSINPVIQFNVGFNYYAAKYFHLFMDASYLAHKHNTVSFPSTNLSSISFKFGLGWQFNAKKALNKS